MTDNRFTEYAEQRKPLGWKLAYELGFDPSAVRRSIREELGTIISRDKRESPRPSDYHLAKQRVRDRLERHREKSGLQGMIIEFVNAETTVYIKSAEKYWKVAANTIHGSLTFYVSTRILKIIEEICVAEPEVIFIYRQSEANYRIVEEIERLEHQYGLIGQISDSDAISALQKDTFVTSGGAIINSPPYNNTSLTEKQLTTIRRYEELKAQREEEKLKESVTDHIDDLENKFKEWEENENLKGKGKRDVSQEDN
jgi:hypothetical protein